MVCSHATHWMSTPHPCVLTQKDTRNISRLCPCVRLVHHVGVLTDWVRFLPSMLAVEVTESLPSVCLWFSTLMTEPSDVQTRNLRCRSSWAISGPSTMVRAKGQGHQVRKFDFWAILQTFFLDWKAWYKTMAYGVMSGRHVTSQNDVKPSCDVTKCPTRDWGVWMLGLFHTIISYFLKEWNPFLYL